MKNRLFRRDRIRVRNSAHIICAIALIVFSLGVSDARADAGQWVVATSEKAQVLIPGGVWQTLNVDTELAPGAEVKVGVGGRAVLKKFGDIVILSPNSHMRLPAGQGADNPSILQKLGTLLYKIRKRDKALLLNVNAKPADKAFKVSTPYLAAIIKGTVFSINASAQGSALHVTEGLVEAISQATGERGLVHPGQTARVSSVAGAGLSISHGGKVRGKAQNNGAEKNEGKTGESNETNVGNGKGQNAKAAKSQGTAKAADNNGGRGLRVSVGNGVLDVSKSSKGLLKAANAGKGQTARFQASGQGRNVPGKGKSGVAGRVKTPGQLTAGLGASAIPGALPNGKAFPGGGSNAGGKGNGGGNGNAGGAGGGGCNGKGKKPGC